MPGWCLQDDPQAVRERGDLRGPGLGGVGLAVDLGQDGIEDEVVKLFLVTDVAVQRAGNDTEAGGERAHAEGLRAVGADDRERLRDDTLAGERAPGGIPVVRLVEPEREPAGFRWLLTCHPPPPGWTAFDSEHWSL